MELRILLSAGLLMFAIGTARADENGYIKAHGKPGDAGVFINGQYVGPAVRFTVPEKYSAPAGEVEVTFKDPRYEDFTTKVTVRPKKTTKIKYVMKKLEEPKPPFGRFRLGGGEPESFVSVAAGDVGAVYINDKFFGYVDELNNPGGGILLPPGTYDLHVVSPLFGDIRQKITIEANKVTVVPLPKKGASEDKCLRRSSVYFAAFLIRPGRRISSTLRTKMGVVDLATGLEDSRNSNGAQETVMAGVQSSCSKNTPI